MSAFRKVALYHRDAGHSYHAALKAAWLYNQVIFQGDAAYRFNYATIRATVRMVYGR